MKLASLTVSFVAPTCASPISCGRTTPVCVSTERVYGETDQASIVSWRYSPVLMGRACAQYRRRRRLADVAFRPLLWVSLSPHPLPGHVQSDTQLKPAVVRGPKCDERIPSSYLSCDRPARKDARRRHTTTGHGCARFRGGQRNNNNTGREYATCWLRGTRETKTHPTGVVVVVEAAPIVLGVLDKPHIVPPRSAVDRLGRGEGGPGAEAGFPTPDTPVCATAAAAVWCRPRLEEGKSCTFGRFSRRSALATTVRSVEMMTGGSSLCILEGNTDDILQ